MMQLSSFQTGFMVHWIRENNVSPPVLRFEQCLTIHTLQLCSTSRNFERTRIIYIFTVGSAVHVCVSGCLPSLKPHKLCDKSNYFTCWKYWGNQRTNHHSHTLPIHFCFRPTEVCNILYIIFLNLVNCILCLHFFLLKSDITQNYDWSDSFLWFNNSEHRRTKAYAASVRNSFGCWFPHWEACPWESFGWFLR